MTLRVHEIYECLQGESTQVGRPMLLVRLAECDLRCVWCDTPDAFGDGTPHELPALLDTIAGYDRKLVLVTGGEPLMQAETPALIDALLARGHEVMLETGGHHDIATVDPRARRIVDFKCPGSGMERANLWSNLEALTPHDEVKFVLADRRDYDWAVGCLGRLPAGVCVLFSPVHGSLDPARLADWILADRLDVRLQLQQHKLSNRFQKAMMNNTTTITHGSRATGESKNQRSGCWPRAPQIAPMMP